MLVRKQQVVSAHLGRKRTAVIIPGVLCPSETIRSVYSSSEGVGDKGLTSEGGTKREQ